MTAIESDQRAVEASLKRIQQLVDQEFTPDQLDELRHRLAENEERFARLRSFPVQNGDEPAPGFRPYRKESDAR